MKLLLIPAFICLAFGAYCQKATYSISDPIDIPQAGWNKLLQMKNGNTLLFHFEERKGIVVKVFDNMHKEIASKKHICKIFDINQQDHASVDGLYEINGEAVLFLEQSVWNKNSLIILRIDPSTASLIEEKIICKSPSFARKQYFTVLKEKNSEGYYVFCEKNFIQNDDTLELKEFNSKHEQIRSVFLNIDKNSVDKFSCLGEYIGSDGNICIALELSKTKISGVRAVYSNALMIGYLKRNSDHFETKLISISDDAAPTYARFTDDNKLLHVAIVDERPYYSESGLNGGIYVDINSLLLIFDKTDWSMKYQWLSKRKINAEVSNPGDTNSNFHGIPVQIFNDATNTTNIVYEEYIMYNTIESGKKVLRTDLGYIGIGKYNDIGDETWGITLPKQQSLRTVLPISEILTRGTEKNLFRHFPEQEYEDQFSSIEVCNNNGVVQYIFFNDFAKNFENTSDNPGAAVTQHYYENPFQYTEAFYYCMKGDGKVTKNYLFEPTSENESKSNMIESGDFNAKTNIYATVILDRKGKVYNTCIAWCELIN
jgi:hypothetical protein